MSKDLDFYQSWEIYPRLGTARKTEIYALKTASKEVVHKKAEATGKLIGNKIAEQIVRPKPVCDMNSRNVEEIVTSLEERQEILNKLRRVLYNRTL